MVRGAQFYNRSVCGLSTLALAGKIGMHYDLLTRFKNGVRAEKESVLVPFSKFNLTIGKFLVDNGFASVSEKRAVGKRTFLEIKIKYKNNSPIFTDFKIVSKPSRHLYTGYREIKSIKQGYGVAAISTPEGVMSNKEAKKKKLGGEYLFEIW